MAKDRIKDLEKNISWPTVSYRRLSQQLNNREDFHENNHSITIEIDNQTSIGHFLKQTDSIRSDIDELDELIQQVKHIHLQSVQTTADPNLAAELDKKRDEIKIFSYEISKELKQMEQELKIKQTELDQSNAQWRIKQSQLFVLIQRFRETMISYNQETVAHRERCKKILVRELEFCGRKQSDDELEEILENDVSGSFNFSILVDKESAKDSLNQMEARHRDLIKLEASLKELHNMFLDLAMLVENQGEMVDNIEHNILKSVDFVQVAAENVSTARKYWTKILRKKIILFIIICVIILIVLFIVIMGFSTTRKLIFG